MHKQMRKFRRRAGLTLQELGARSGVSPSTIQHWEQGQGMNTVVNISAVCDALGISIDEYIGRGTPGPMKQREEELDMLVDHAERILAICEELKGEKK